MDALLPGLLRHRLYPPTWASCHVAVGDDDSEEGRLDVRLVVGQLVGHAFEGAVSKCALSFVSNPTKVPDEVLFGCERAEHKLRLGEVQASYGPADVDLALVFLICQLLGKDLGELLDAFNQDSRWGLL